MPVKKGMILMVNLMERFDGHFSQELIVTVGVSIKPQIAPKRRILSGFILRFGSIRRFESQDGQVPDTGDPLRLSCPDLGIYPHANSYK
jgi:hypothetical protein